MDNNEQSASVQVTELDLLKQRAKMMGIVFSNNIGIEALKAKVNAKMNDEPEPKDASDPQPNGLEAAAEVGKQKDTAVPFGSDYKPQLDHDENGINGGAKPSSEELAKLTPNQLRTKQMKEQLRLVRIRIQCLDPKKKDLHGEIITVANEVIGTVRKFVPFGEASDDGYHVPYIIYKQLERRKFLNIRTGKDRRTGMPTVSSSWAKEFAIEVLDPLTADELQRLAAAQAAAGSMNT